MVTPRRRSLLLAALLLLMVAAVGAALLHLQRSKREAAVAVAALPPTPELTSWPAELGHRIQSCERRIRAAEEATAALAELSRLYHANGFLSEALQCYPALEVLEPEEARWPHRHASILAGYGAAEPALARWARVLELEPDYTVARLRTGDLLLKLNRLDEAAATYAAVLERAPDEPYALLGLARGDIEAGRWTAARDRLERVVQMTNFVLGYDLIVTVYEQLGQHDRARAIRGQAMASGAYRDPPDPWMDELYADSYDLYQLSLVAGAAERNGDVNLAVRLLERALRFGPDQASLHFQLGLTFVTQGETARARSHLERCTQLDPGFSDAWSHLSQLLLNQGDRAGAERAIAQGLGHNPESYALHLMRARRLQEAGRWPDAVRAYQHAIRLRPNSADARIELAVAYFRTERIEEGAEQLRLALAAEPEHPTALATLAMHAVSVGDEAGARRWIERARQQPRVATDRMREIRAAFRQRFGADPF